MSATRVSRRSLEPRKLPSQARSEWTVAAILQAAAQVFERHGYAAGTTNRIAARAGVSIGSLYQYFPNKDAILVALVRGHLAEAAAALEPHLEGLRSGAPLDELLADVVETMVAIHAQAPRLHRVLFEEAPLPRALQSEIARLEDRVVESLAAALSAGADRRPPSDPQLSARIVVGAIEGLTHRLVLYQPAGVPSNAIAREVTELVRSYVRDLSARR